MFPDGLSPPTSSLSGGVHLGRAGKAVVRACRFAAALLAALGIAAPGSATLAAGSAHGIWGAVPPPSRRSGHTAIYDPIRDRIILFGGYDGANRNDVWVLPLGGTAEWSELAPPGEAPTPRANHSAIYDPVRDRMLVFGGTDGVSYRNDVWALSLSGSPAWSQLTPSGAPPSARVGQAAIYDPPRDRLVIFGGDDGGLTVLNDCWSLSLSGTPAWSAISTSGNVPLGRSGHAAIYDPLRDRMIVFGGDDGTLYFNDVEALSLSTAAWSVLAASGAPPSGRSRHTAVYDSNGDRLVVFGGEDAAFRFNQTWGLTLAGDAAWAELAPSGVVPSARARHAAVYDPLRGRLIVLAGYDGGLLADSQQLSLGPAPQWSSLVASGPLPSARYRHGVAYDPGDDRMLVYGGYDGLYPYPDGAWALPLGGAPSWAAIATSGTIPAGRYGHTSLYDPLRRRMIVFGGHDGTSRVDQVWALSLAGTPTWSLLQPSGTPPSGRQNHSAVYDPIRDRMLVFGGFDGARRNDVWSLSLGGAPAWTQLVPAGTPPSARSNHVAIYDPIRDRMIVFGGSDGAPRNDVWALSLSGEPAWSALAVSGTPPTARAGHAAVYEPVRDRMVTFGGDDLTFQNDAWALSLSGAPAWSPLAPSGALPPGRRYHTALYDPKRDRLVVLGGWDGYYRDDAATLTWGDPAKPAAGCGGDLGAAAGSTVDAVYSVSHPLAGSRAVEWILTSDRAWPGFPLRGMALIAASQVETVAVSIVVPDTAAPGPNPLRFAVALAGVAGNDSICLRQVTVTGAVGISASAQDDFVLHGIQPHPVVTEAAVSFTVPAAGQVTVEVFDLEGRRLVAGRKLDVGAGHHLMPIVPELGMRSGVYLVRLTYGSRSLECRAVVLR